MYKSNKSWVGHVLEKHLSTYCYTVQLNNTTNYMCVQGGDYTSKYKTKLQESTTTDFNLSWPFVTAQYSERPLK